MVMTPSPCALQVILCSLWIDPSQDHTKDDSNDLASQGIQENADVSILTAVQQGNQPASWEM